MSGGDNVVLNGYVSVLDLLSSEGKDCHEPKEGYSFAQHGKCLLDFPRRENNTCEVFPFVFGGAYSELPRAYGDS